MKSQFFNRIRGYVQVEIRGKVLERLLNAVIERRFGVWDIRRKDEHTVLLYILVSDFFRLRPLLKQTGSRVRVKGRFGLPFLLDKLGRRKTFVAGIVAFIVGIYLLSSLIWSVDVEGNDKLSASDIFEAARKQGIERFQWKFRLKDPDTLSRELQRQLPGTAWVGVEIEGTRVRIKVVESTRPDERELMSPRHLVASKNALVTEILAEKGKPLVRPNMNVKKGDILISGVIGDEASQQTVVAKGTVRGIVWHEATIEIPLVLKQKVYTGETKSRSYLVIGSRGLQVTGYGKLPFSQYEIKPDRKVLQWRQYMLPIGWLKETYMESKLEEIPLEPEEAKRIALEHARAEVTADAGADAKLRGEKIILHEKSDNGKVYMKALFEVEQNIAEELPIVSQPAPSAPPAR
jgi:similar to stage IV sporulation protein